MCSSKIYILIVQRLFHITWQNSKNYIYWTLFPVGKISVELRCALSGLLMLWQVTECGLSLNLFRFVQRCIHTFFASLWLLDVNCNFMDESFSGWFRIRLCIKQANFCLDISLCIPKISFISRAFLFSSLPRIQHDKYNFTKNQKSEKCIYKTGKHIYYLTSCL
jgi:hypothetical protein